MEDEACMVILVSNYLDMIVVEYSHNSDGMLFVK